MRVSISHIDISKSSWENLKMRLRYTGNEEDIALCCRDAVAVNGQLAQDLPAV